MRKYHKVGATFRFKGDLIKVEEADSAVYNCSGCAFAQSATLCGNVACLPCERDGNPGVIFKVEVEYE